MADSSITDSVEVWKAIPGWEGLYEISSLGRVRSLPRRRKVLHGGWYTTGGAIIKGDHSGRYLRVRLSNQSLSVAVSIHRAVCEVFHGAPPTPKHHAAHADGNRYNNRSDNLRWATAKENNADQEAHGTRIRGEKHFASVINDEIAVDIRRRHAAGAKQLEIAEMYGVSRCVVFDVVHRKTWAHI